MSTALTGGKPGKMTMLQALAKAAVKLTEVRRGRETKRAEAAAGERAPQQRRMPPVAAPAGACTSAGVWQRQMAAARAPTARAIVGAAARLIFTGLSARPRVPPSLARAQMAGRAKKVIDEKKRRAQFAVIANTSEKWTWITDEKEGFVPAKVLKELPDGSVEVEYGVARAVKVISKKELGPPIVRLAEIKNHVEGASPAAAARPPLLPPPPAACHPRRYRPCRLPRPLPARCAQTWCAWATSTRRRSCTTCACASPRT